METYLELFLLPLLAGLTLILVWFAAKTAWEQTLIDMKNGTQAKNGKTNSGLTSTERKELSKDFEQDNSNFIVGPSVRYGNFFGREEIIGNLFIFGQLLNIGY